MKKSLLTSLLSLSLAATLSAQDTQPAAAGQSFNDWFSARVLSLVSVRQAAAKAGEMPVVANGKGIARDKQSPASDTRSTSLVDQSSAPDLFSVAANLVPVSSLLGGSSSATPTTPTSGASGSGSVTASLYAILASAHGVGVTDPGFYSTHASARRLSFTLGTAESTKATDNTTDPATVVGAKFLALDSREIFTSQNNTVRKAVQDASGILGIAQSFATLDVEKLIVETTCPGRNFAGGAVLLDQECLNQTNFVTKTLPQLPADVQKRIDAIIDAAMTEKTVALEKQINDAYDLISTAPQIAFSYSGTLRTGSGYSNHRGTAIVDFGVSKPVSFTINASADFTDRKGIAANSSGGRFATEMQYQAVRPSATSTRSALVFSFSGEGDWMTTQKPQYTGQAKLSLPIAPGIDLPIAYRYQNSAAQLNASDSQGKLGLSIDIAKVLQSLKFGL